MGLIQTMKIKIRDITPKEKSFDYLKPRGEIVIRKDEDFDIPVFEIRAEGWYSATVHLWPKSKSENECLTPRVSYVSANSGYDEVDSDKVRRNFLV